MPLAGHLIVSPDRIIDDLDLALDALHGNGLHVTEAVLNDIGVLLARDVAAVEEPPPQFKTSPPRGVVFDANELGPFDRRGDGIEELPGYLHHVGRDSRDLRPITIDL